jgi:hypothetical protein
MPKKKPEAKPETEATPTSGQEGSASSGFERTAVVGLPKFNPHAGPATTEQVSTVPIRQSYEDIQETAKGPGVAEWREVDKLRTALSSLYQSLKEDERYAEAYKSERAWDAYERTKARIEELAPAATEKMLRSAEGLERMSIPTPAGESLITQDTNKLLLTAHERSRIEKLLERAEKASGKAPFRVKPDDILANEYARGLSQGGPGGGATVRAVVEVARDYGLDINSVVDAYRKDLHHGALQDAQQARLRANMVSRSVRQPPFPTPGAPQTTGAHGSQSKQFIPHEKGVLFPKRRRAAWK